MLQSALNTIGNDAGQQPVQNVEAPVAPATPAPQTPVAPSVETTTAPYQEVVQPQEVQYIVPEDSTQPTVKETIVELDGPADNYGYDNGYNNMQIEPITVSDIPQQVAYDNSQYVNNQVPGQADPGMLDQQSINMMLNNF